MLYNEKKSKVIAKAMEIVVTLSRKACYTIIDTLIFIGATPELS